MSEAEECLSPESVLSLLKSRRSIRRYQPDPVPDWMVVQLLEAGRWAPSAGNRQPWAFIAVRDEAVRRQIAQHAAAYVIRWVHAEEAPLLIVLCGNTQNPVYRRFLHEDIGLAGGQIMLQAKALGLGTCWIGGFDRQAIASILRVPDHMEIIGLLTVGFPAEAPHSRSRRPLPEVAYYDIYGNPIGGEDITPGRVPGGLLGRLLRRFRLKIRP